MSMDSSTRQPDITVIYAPAANTKTLFVNGDRVVRAEGRLGDPLHLVDEAARHLAEIHQVPVRELTCERADSDLLPD